MKEERVFIAAVIVSMVLHLLLLRVDAGVFTEPSAAVYIPVTMTPASNLEQERADEPPEMVVPELPDQHSDGAAARRGSLSALEDRYIEVVREEIERRKFTPAGSRYYGLIGSVTVGLVVGPRGRFHDVAIIHSSGDQLLDATALRAVAATNGHIKRPPWSGSRELTVRLVIKYQYRL